MSFIFILFITFASSSVGWENCDINCPRPTIVCNLDFSIGGAKGIGGLAANNANKEGGSAEVIWYKLE